MIQLKLLRRSISVVVSMLSPLHGIFRVSEKVIIYNYPQAGRVEYCILEVEAMETEFQLCEFHSCFFSSGEKFGYTTMENISIPLSSCNLKYSVSVCEVQELHY